MSKVKGGGPPEAEPPESPETSLAGVHPFVQQRRWAQEYGYVTEKGVAAGFVGLLPSNWIQRGFFVALVKLNIAVGRLEERVFDLVVLDPHFQAEARDISQKLRDLHRRTQYLTRDIQAYLGRDKSAPHGGAE